MTDSGGLSRQAIDLVARACDGAVVDRRESYHVMSPAHGRVRVHARSRASRSLKWFHVPAPAGASYDAVVLIEFERDGHVAAAWILSTQEIQAAATSHTRSGTHELLKVPVGGSWTAKSTQFSL